MKTNTKWVVALVWAATVALPVFLAADQHAKVERAKLALGKTKADLALVTEQSEKLAVNVSRLCSEADRQIAIATLFQRMLAENEGLSRLSTEFMGDLASVVEVQKKIIARGTSPTETETELIRGYEVKLVAASKALPAYTARIKSIGGEMQALSKR